MNIPFVDLNSQYLSIKKEIDNAISTVFASGRFDQGEEVHNFEKEFAHYLGAKDCVSLNSGTDGLVLGVRGLALNPGDEIIVPTFTFIASAIAGIENNLKPVFVDADDKDFGMNLADLKRKINSRTKAIILVHLFGQPDKLDEVQEIIKKTGKKIYLIEDACQAHGAEYKKRKVGNFGIFSVFSFYPTKNLGAYGDGGALVTNNNRLANKYRLLKQYGQKKRYYSKINGVNSRLDNFQAAILRVKLRHLDQWNKKRRSLAKIYKNLLQRDVPDIKTPIENLGRESVYHLYVIQTKKRNALLRYLQDKRINPLIHYPVPLHLQEAYKNLGYRRGDLPIAEKMTSKILSLPFYAEMSERKIREVVNSIVKFSHDAQ